MRELARLRQWINRDDGRHYQIGNRSIGACEAAGHLGIIAAAVLWLLHAKPGLSSYWACAAVGLGILLFAVSGLLNHQRDTKKNPPAQSDEESSQPPQSH